MTSSCSLGIGLRIPMTSDSSFVALFHNATQTKKDAEKSPAIETTVLEEGYATKPSTQTDAPATAFDMDKLLDDLFPPKTAVPDAQERCPVCEEALQYDEIDKSDGSLWRYVRCPRVNNFTKCFVACGLQDADIYLSRERNSLDPVYAGGVDHFEPASMRCYCNRSLILALSKSEKNRHRIYFKCPKGQCSFFQGVEVVGAGCQSRGEGCGATSQALRFGKARPLKDPSSPGTTDKSKTQTNSHSTFGQLHVHIDG